MEPGQFPGPLYSPGAAPAYTPSKKTPFAVAIKRCLGHCGFWPWDPDNYDEAYSDALAYGVEGNPHKAGVKAFQAWSGTIQPTGNWGEKSFNFARSVTIPEGRDNEGDPAWDQVCIQLTEEAYDLAHAPPPPEPAANPRDSLWAHFAQRDGYTEQPSDSNCDNRDDGIRTAQDMTAQGSTWLRNEPWCGCWCYYALAEAGVTGMNSWMASVASIEDRAKQKLSPFTGWTTDRSRVRVGDLTVIGGYGVHVETVRGISGSNTLTWGGNTSSGTSGSQSDGGGAFERTRYPSEVRGYALVRYPGE
jgi:hypothetical protein